LVAKAFFCVNRVFGLDSDAFCLPRQMQQKYLYCSSVNEIKIPVNATAYLFTNKLQTGRAARIASPTRSFPSYCTPNKISVENKRSGVYISMLCACDCFVTVVVFKIIFPP
jgi:hypothetical protein